MKSPKQAALFVTSKCNQACTYCATAPNRALCAPDMTPEVAERLFDMFPTISGVGIGGGEPLLNPGIRDIVRLCLNRSKSVTISTNGTLVNNAERGLGKLWSRVAKVNVSMTAATRDRYIERSGVDMLDRAVEGVKALQQLGASIVLSFVIERDNVQEIARYARLAKYLKVDRVAFQSICPTAGRYDEFWDRAIDGDDAVLMRSVEAGLKRAYVMGIKVTQKPDPVYRYRPGRGCRMALNHISVDGAGNVAICCRGPGPRAEMGNLEQGPEVWSTGPMAERRAAVMSKNPPEKCTLCKAYWR